MIVAAELEFLNPTTPLRERLQGGRQIIQPAKFTSVAASWSDVQWRLVVIPVSKMSDAPLRWLARVRWLMEDAPHQALTPAAEFELMESMTLPMARGRILSGALVPMDSDAPDLSLV